MHSIKDDQDQALKLFFNISICKVRSSFKVSFQICLQVLLLNVSINNLNPGILVLSLILLQWVLLLQRSVAYLVLRPSHFPRLDTLPFDLFSYFLRTSNKVKI